MYWRRVGLTTLIIPIRMFGGVALLFIITLMNFAVMPIMAIRELGRGGIVGRLRREHHSGETFWNRLDWSNEWV